MDEIQVENLTKSFGGKVRAVDGLSFAVHKGEVFGLLGPNGAGKSTTVRILSTLTEAGGGRALVAGEDVARTPAAVRRKIGYVAQNSGVDKWQTGRENLTLQAHLQRLPAAQVQARVKELLAWVELSDAADRLVNTYSGGMKRRLDIAMGLVHRPQVLFLDEPTTGLDPETRRALWDDLKRLRDAGGLTVLLTTHYLEEADALCDRIAIVDHGRLVTLGTPAELKAEIGGDVVTLVYTDGREEQVKVPDGASALPRLIGERSQVVRASVSRPSLDDVYLHHTGRQFDARDGEADRGGWH
jgi:ABC-2 type transport system ATP-binding protein